MSEPDEYGQEAERMVYHSEAPATAVAAKLRAQGQEIAKLNGIILARSVEWGRVIHEIAQLKAEIDEQAQENLRLRKALQHEAGANVRRCACVLEGGLEDKFVLVCELHKAQGQ